MESIYIILKAYLKDFPWRIDRVTEEELLEYYHRKQKGVKQDVNTDGDTVFCISNRRGFP